MGVLCLNLLARHWVDDIRYQVDPRLGEVFRPGTIHWRMEGDGISHWKEHGLRQTGNDASSGPRVLLLGDSFVEARQVDDAQTFASLSERELAARGQALRILNAGKGGRSVADYVWLAPALKDQFAPDWTVIAVQDSDWEEEAWRDSMPHFANSAAGLTVLPGRPPGTPSHLDLFRPLRYLVRYRAKELAQRWAQEPLLFRATDCKIGPIRPRYPLSEEFALLRRAFPGGLSLLYFPRFDATRARPTSSRVERQLQALCLQHGVQFLNVGDQFPWILSQGQAPQGFPNTAYGEGHYNTYGHIMVSLVLTRGLLQLRTSGQL